MKGLVLLVLLATGCPSSSSPSPQPGEPTLSIGSDWIRGEAVKGFVSWPSAMPCNEDGGPAGCADGTMTVLSMTCHGCFLPVDWSNTTMPTSTRLEVLVAATADGPVSVDIMMRFDDTGDVRTVSASATADHEVTLTAQCRLIDASTLAQLTQFATIADASLRDCNSPRQAGDRVVILPAVTTQHGDPRFPFCLAGYPCDGPMGEQFRALSSLVMTPTPTLWAVSKADTPGAFAVLPALTSTLPITLSTKLATGESVAAMVTPPPP